MRISIGTELISVRSLGTQWFRRYEAAEDDFVFIKQNLENSTLVGNLLICWNQLAAQANFSAWRLNLWASKLGPNIFSSIHYQFFIQININNDQIAVISQLPNSTGLVYKSI